MRHPIKDNQREINVAIRAYFYKHGISLKEVQARLGYANIQTVRNQLSTGYFGKVVARKWAKEFGFNEDFLTSGKGDLVQGSDLKLAESENKQLKDILSIQEKMLVEERRFDASPEVRSKVADAIRGYVRSSGVPRKYMAIKLGYRTLAAFKSALLRMEVCNVKSLRRWANGLGFNMNFILTGTGPLLNHNTPEEAKAEENETLRARIRSNAYKLKANRS